MKGSRGRLALVFAAALCAAFAASAPVAQEKGGEEKKAERPAAQPLSVRLSALVLDSQNRLVDDLRTEDFQLLEDGVPQKIAAVERQEGPHAFGLVIDNSGSLRRDINNVVEFGRWIVAGTGAESEGFVVRFVGSDNVKVLQDMTASKQALSAALDNMFIEGGQTAINDALYLSAERLAQHRRAKKTPFRYSLILVTDGEDRASYYNKEQVFEKLRGSGLRVFVVGFVQSEYRSTTPEKARQYMSRIAFESGGSAHFVRKGGELGQVAKQILAEMSANYVVGYDSTNAKRDGSTRKVQLTVAGGAGGGQRKVLAADGYVAPKK